MLIARPSVCLLFTSLLVAAALSPSGPLASEEVSPEALGPLGVEPESVTLSRFGEAPVRVLVIAREPVSPNLPQELQLSHTASPGIAVDVGPVERAARGDAVWKVTLSAGGDAPDQGFVEFRLRAESPPDASETGTAVVQVWRARLQVTIEPSRNASPVADAALSIASHSATIDQLAPLAAYLKIENTSNHPLRFEVIDISAPPFLHVWPGMANGGIGAHETMVVPLEMKVVELPRTGQWLIVARIALARGEGAFIQKGVALVEHKISVGMAEASNALKVEPAREGSPLDDVTLSIKFDSKTINELVSETAYLLIENTSVRPVRLEGTEISTPDFLCFSPAKGGDNAGADDAAASGSRRSIWGILWHIFENGSEDEALADGGDDTGANDAAALANMKATIAPHETMIVPLVINVCEGKRPQIGDWLILGRVTLARGEGALEQRGIGVVEKTVTVGVPGVSEVLTILELPSILLVPGALILATWSLLLGSGKEAKPDWLKWKEASFWLVAITLSILVFGGLTLVQSWFKIATNFLVAFGIRDVAWLWLGSVGVTALAYGLQRAARAVWRRTHEPMTSDPPLEILKKLQRAEKPFYLPPYQYGTSDPRQTIFALEFAAPDGEIWVIPRMLVQARVESEKSRDLLQRIVSANNRHDGLGDLIEALEEGTGGFLARGLLHKPFWEAGKISHPQTLPHDQLGTPGSRPDSPLKLAEREAGLESEPAAAVGVAP